MNLVSQELNKGFIAHMCSVMVTQWMEGCLVKAENPLEGEKTQMETHTHVDRIGKGCLAIQWGFLISPSNLGSTQA